MQPYQAASQKMRESGEYPLEVLKNLGLTAVGGAAAKVGSRAASSLIPHVMALISEHVPEKFSKAALSKLDPRFGKFINGAEQEGYNYDEVKKLIGEKMNQPQEAAEEKNIVQKYSPELHQFIQEQIQSGRSPLEAGALATLDKKGGKGFKGIIDKIVKDNKAPWAAILQTIYGQGQRSQQQQEQPQQGQQQQGQQGNAKWDQIASTLQNLLKS